MNFIDSTMTILEWLKLAIDDTSDGKRVKERYMMNKKSWKVWYRPDCNIETAYAFLKAWEHTKDNSYLQLARDIYSSIVKMQKADGSFPFAHTGDTHIYTNDNSEVPIFLFRMAEIDSEMADTYRQTALKGMDFILSIQNENGSWRVVDNDPHTPAMFTAHAVSGLAHAYAYTTNKTEYKAAIEKGLDFITTQILDNGRIKTCYETNNGTEYWRPPSSDQAIVIRAFAHAEYYISDSSKKDEWKRSRLKLIKWFDRLIDVSGAIKNGLGENINGADLQGLTDHVYTTAFGIEAYQWSYYVDNNPDYLNKAMSIANFAANNLYYSDEPETNGTIRGAYNIQDNNWDTSSLILNSGQEGGADMIYTGWVNAPLVALFFTLSESSNYSIKIYDGVKTINLPLYDTQKNNICLSIYLNEKIRYIYLVDKNDANASNLRLYINGDIHSIRKE